MGKALLAVVPACTARRGVKGGSERIIASSAEIRMLAGKNNLFGVLVGHTDSKFRHGMLGQFSDEKRFGITGMCLGTTHLYVSEAV